MPLLVDNDQDQVRIPPGLLDKLEAVLAEVTLSEGLEPEVEISLLFVDDRRIAELNRQYRNHDCSTDVLAFAMRERTESEPEILDPAGDFLLGDVVISLETALRQSAEYGHSLEREVAYLFLHGVLHLLGYDHEEEQARQEMRAKEENILNRLALVR